MTTSIQSDNWLGRIPIQVSLAPTSLSSPSMPSSLFVLVSRHTFLHVGLQAAVLRLYKYAPSVSAAAAASGSFSSHSGLMKRQQDDDDDDNDKNMESNKQDTTTTMSGGNSNDNDGAAPEQYPVCWFEDEESQFALRWHLFVGVLWDMKEPTPSPSGGRARTKTLPWKIRLHFTQYPSSQILPLDMLDNTGTNNGSQQQLQHRRHSSSGGGIEGPDNRSSPLVLTTVERHFRNSLKQALFMQYASSKVAMNMSKQAHNQLWDSIATNNYHLYQQVNADSCLLLQQSQSSSSSLLLHSTATASNLPNNLVPIRLFVNATKPPIQRPCRISSNDNESDDKSSSSFTTLGSLLVEWCPDLFCKDERGVIQPRTCTHTTITWTIQGIQQVELSTSLVELWTQLSCPDHFLYIVVTTQSP